MKVRVLGCSGAISKGCRTTSFLIDDDVLIDAGTGVGDLSLSEMRRIDHVFLTHSHLDHIAALPLMIDAVASQRHTPLKVHALAPTIEALKMHVFNNVIWPDFSRIPSERAPLLSFEPIEAGSTTQLAGKSIEALPAAHTVPAVGYSVRSHRSGGCWVFSGDTCGDAAFWARVNALPVRMLVIETAFSNDEREIAELSRHLSPQRLASELDSIVDGATYPIYVTHTKPAQTQTIMREIAELAEAPAFAAVAAATADMPRAHDIRWLGVGQEFEI